MATPCLHAQFVTGFETHQSSSSPGYTTNATLIGVQDIQAPEGKTWTRLFGSDSAMTVVSTLPAGGTKAFCINDQTSTSAQAAFLDLAEVPGLPFDQPFTVSFSMSVESVSASTGNQIQVYLGAPSTSLGSAKYWTALIYDNGQLRLHVGNAAGNNTQAVSLGQLSEYVNGTGYLTVRITIDPTLKKYTRVEVSGSKKSTNHTEAVQAVHGGTLPWIPASGPQAPESKLLFVTGVNDLVKVRFDAVQVVPATLWFEGFAPGVLASDEGTIEMTATLSRPMSQFGNTSNYDFLFKVLPAQRLAAGTTLLGVYVPSAAAGTGLYGISRKAEGTTYVTNGNFSPPEGVPVRIAFTWGNVSKLFVNGTLVASAPSVPGDVAPLPALFRVARRDPFNVSEIRVSDVARSTVDGNAGTPLVPDEHTTMLSTNTLTFTRYFRSTRFQASGFMSLTPYWKPEDQCLVEGTVPGYSLVSINHSGTTQSFSVHLQAEDRTGAVVHETTTSLSVPGDSRHRVVTIPLTNVTSRGHYKVRASITDPDGATKQFENAVAVFPANDTTLPDGSLDHYLGHHYPIEEWSPVVLNRMGIKTNRAFGELSGFYWFAVQPTANTFTWTRTDLMVDRARAAGIDLLAVLGAPPPWAAEDPGSLHKNDPRNLPYSLMSGRWKPRLDYEWGSYVSNVVSRYKNSVKNWEIWNEVDWHPPGKAYSFSGNTTDYLSLLQNASIQARAADSSCNVLISGFSLIGDADPAMPTALLSLGASTSFDTFASHAYNNSRIAELNSALFAAKGPNAPHWMTEHMWNAISYEESRIFQTIELYVRCLDLGLDRFYQFGSEGFCFDSATQSPRIDTYVHAVFQSQIRKTNAYAGKCLFAGSENFGLRHQFVRTDGRTLTVVGQHLATNRLIFSGTIRSAQDLLGRPLSSTSIDGNTQLDVRDGAYILSDQPLTITGVQVLESAPLILNTGFEEISGDLDTGGLESCEPLHWVLRETTFDPSGSISLTDSSKQEGNYAVKTTTSGAGRVYVFQNAQLSQPGTYRISAWVRRPYIGESAVPYLCIYNVDHGLVLEKTFPGVPAGGAYTFVSGTCQILTQREKPFSIIAGARSGTGTVLVDDVNFVRIGP